MSRGTYLSARAFTLIEMVTVVAIIAVLVSLLLPAVNMVRAAAAELRQRSQFNSVEIALEAFRSDFGDYPRSDDPGSGGFATYPGAEKLGEAMIGMDGYGLHPDSRFTKFGTDTGAPVFAGGTPLYKPGLDTLTQPEIDASMNARQGLYLELETANAAKLSDIYAVIGNLPDSFVLADTFRTVTHRKTGDETGMPILYYRADPSKKDHYAASPGTSTYNYVDNESLLALIPPSGGVHPMYQPALPDIFYNMTRNASYSDPHPYRGESFILISAGPDGLYGTADDVTNFND